MQDFSLLGEQMLDSILTIYKEIHMSMAAKCQTSFKIILNSLKHFCLPFTSFYS